MNNPNETDQMSVYTAASPLEDVSLLLRRTAAELWNYRGLAWVLFMRDIRSQYRQSYLGYIWLFIPVIATTVLWLFLQGAKVVNVESTRIPYPIFLTIGSIVWSLFATSLTQPLASFQSGQAIFMKLAVPPECFIIAGVCKVLFETLIRLALIAILFLIYQVPPAGSAYLFPVGLLGTAVAGISIGYLLIPLGSLYSDIAKGLNTILPFAMYIAPVVYPIPSSGFARSLMLANPVTPLVETSRDWLVLGSSEYTIHFGCVFFVSILVLALAVISLRAVMPLLVERMGM